MKYSHSKIKKYRGCAHAFKLDYIDHVPTGVHENLIFGSMAHEIFEHINKTMAAGNFVGAETIAGGVFNDPEIRKENPVDPARYDEMLKIAENMAARTVIGDDYYGAEEMFSFTRDYKEVDWDDPTAFFRGKLDRLDMAGEVAVIRDYKTSFYAEYDQWQGDIYAWIIFHLFPQINQIYPIFDFPRVRQERPDPSNPIIITRSDLPALDKKILGLIDIIEADTEFNPTPGAACDYCDFSKDCPYMVSNIEKAESLEEAKQLGADITALRTKANKKTDALKKWVTTNGAVESNGFTFKFYEGTECTTGDTESFMIAAEEMGIDPFEYLKVDTTKLKKRIEKSDEDDPIRDLAVITLKQTWGSRKTK